MFHGAGFILISCCIGCTPNVWWNVHCCCRICDHWNVMEGEQIALDHVMEGEQIGLDHVLRLVYQEKKSEIHLMGWPMIIMWFRFTSHGLNCDFGGAAAVTTTNTSKTISLYFPEKDGTFFSFQLYYIWCCSSGTFDSWVFRDCCILCSLYLRLVTFVRILLLQV